MTAPNTAFGWSAGCRSRAQAVAEVAKTLQIEHLLKRNPSQLSGGQRQRVAMGRALVRQPQVFLFDEPLSNLDAKLRVEMRTEIKRLHQAVRTTMVYVTHDQIEAMTLATQIAVMNAGEIQQLGTPQEIYNRPSNIFVAGFMGSPSMNMMAAALRTAPGPAGASRPPTVTPAPAARAGGQGARGLRKREVILGLRPEVSPTRVAPTAAAIRSRGPIVSSVVEPAGSDTFVVTRLRMGKYRMRADADVAKTSTVRLRHGQGGAVRSGDGKRIG
jgi:multiple sugar transport system ATP-binding protein